MLCRKTMEEHLEGRTKQIGGPEAACVPQIGQPYCSTSDQYANHLTVFFALWFASVLWLVRGGFPDLKCFKSREAPRSSHKTLADYRLEKLGKKIWLSNWRHAGGIWSTNWFCATREISFHSPQHVLRFSSSLNWCRSQEWWSITSIRPYVFMAE